MPFTKDNNEKGIINGPRLLKALKTAYGKLPEGTVSPCEEIYLTLEVFTGTAVIVRDLLKDLEESVLYWRQWVPQDGMYLDEIVS